MRGWLGLEDCLRGIAKLGRWFLRAQRQAAASRAQVQKRLRAQRLANPLTHRLETWSTDSAES